MNDKVLSFLRDATFTFVVAGLIIFIVTVVLSGNFTYFNHDSTIVSDWSGYVSSIFAVFSFIIVLLLVAGGSFSLSTKQWGVVSACICIAITMVAVLFTVVVPQGAIQSPERFVSILVSDLGATSYFVAHSVVSAFTSTLFVSAYTSFLFAGTCATLIYLDDSAKARQIRNSNI